jgi:hypothetical protein
MRPFRWALILLYCRSAHSQQTLLGTSPNKELTKRHTRVKALIRQEKGNKMDRKALRLRFHSINNLSLPTKFKKSKPDWTVLHIPEAK